ncbi:MAG: hypothetical protein GFGODING_02981 [Flavobacteriales bacterium]|nr:hypothetical protein [Flavobacteriales bacterium]
MREVLLDRPLSKVEEHYTDHALWKLPVGMSGQYGRLGLLLDGSPISRVVSFNWSGAFSFERLDGKFRFASNELPYSAAQEDRGFRRLDVIRLESALGMKVRLFKGLVVRLGALLSTPVYGAQRTIWTRVITDENGLRHEHDLDENTEASDDLYYGSFGDGIVPAGYAELAYEFKRGVGLQIRGTCSVERSSSIGGRSGSFSVGWSTYAVGAGFTFRLVPSDMPRSNWGGVKPMSTEEVRELRRARKATNAPVQDTMQMVQTPSTAPGPLPLQAGVDAPLPVTPKDTVVAFADTSRSDQASSDAPKASPSLPATADPVQEEMAPQVVPTPRSEARAVQDAQYAGCAVALERTDGSVTQVRSEEVGSAPPASSTALRVQWAGRADGKRWLWLRLLPASGAPPPLVRATLAWGDGRRMVIASDLRPAESVVRPDGSAWHGVQLTDQEWRTIGEQMPNELALITKSGPLQVVWMAEERRALGEQRACLDQWFLANSSAAIPTAARSPIGSGTMPPVQAEHPGDTKQQMDLSGGAAETSVAAPPPGQHVQQGSLSTNAGTTTRSPDEGRLAYKVITERPEDFAAVSVYTVLHVFSSSTALDTFRVVTRHGPMGGLKHELWISTLAGATYREELYPVPLQGALDAGRIAGEEMEMLRVRMALAPGAFQPNPISVDDWRLSGARAGRDLLYDLSIAEFDSVFMEKPAIGFQFQSDAETRRELVYSNTLRRIVNVAPQ